MKPIDDQLNRLLRSAAKAPLPAPGEAPFPLEARVLAGWRRQAQNDAGDFLLAWFRRAAVFGCMLALASAAWTYQTHIKIYGGELAVADSAMSTGVEP